ncbi:hypothetical protein NGM10_11700 [Halorussus salilacus]|uniref:hypothetical protein n=1 Tax=Halorussus salilacus TaxID=2953750 RepID=UPI0020A09583|nr:hypothetical protein [Halorussus salilacus]USZ67389.1 hypothetical protein NGM10_11700 [Halorussus salilacus]
MSPYGASDLAEETRDPLAPDLQYAERRNADAEYTHVDISKANELIWYGPTTIQDGVEKLTEWYRKNPG